MATVYHSSSTNSTHFTTCCEVAVVDTQNNCPHCGQIVVPEGDRARFRVAMDHGSGNWYPNHGKGRGYFEANGNKYKREYL